MSPRFLLVPTNEDVIMRGVDDHDKPFELTLDRVWVMNLQLELNDWLSVGSGNHKVYLKGREAWRVDI